MMKKLLIALGVSAAMVSGSALAAGQATSLTDPTLFVKNIVDHINAGTCVPDFESNGLGILAEELNLSGGAGQEQFPLNNTKVGSNKKEFSLAFKQCPPAGESGKNKLSIHIDTSNPSIITTVDDDKGLSGNELRNVLTGTNAAKNVYVRLFNAENPENPLTFGQSGEIVKDLPNYASNPEGRIEFKFAAQLYAPKGNATSGQIQAQAPFVVEYK